MRKILAFVAAFTLSSTSTATIVACNPSSERGTTNVFDWNSAFKATGTTTDDFFKYLLDNPSSGWGNTLYSSINQYINLSILKSDPKYAAEYHAALISAKSEMENTIKSLQAKFGRGWEKQWKKILGDQDVNAYLDTILKKSALSIIQRTYVTSNYRDYKYYNQNEIVIWLKDIWTEIKKGTYSSVLEYVNGKTNAENNTNTPPGLYANKVWIVANANNLDPTMTTFAELDQDIKNNTELNKVKIAFPVVQTKDDKNSDNFIADTYNTIDGLLSDNQAKIAKVMLRNQELLWTRQIVVPINSNVDPYTMTITNKSFEDNKRLLNSVIDGISKNGFNQTFLENQGTTNEGDITKTGDLGLIDINKSTKDNSPFYYYLYRYVTSAQGAGVNIDKVQKYNLTQFTPDSSSKDPDDENVRGLIPFIDRKVINSTNDPIANNTSRKYNDLVYMPDKAGSVNTMPDPATNNGPGVGIFIDKTGIHFIQTPGITYQQLDKPSASDKTYDIIKKFKQHPFTTADNYQWKDLAPLSERPNGLSDTPYLDYLQTIVLLQKYGAADQKASFNLNDALTSFTNAGSEGGSLSDASWWDYNLYFNNNSTLINWNLQSITGSTINGADDKINEFVRKMRDWFNKTKETRWTNRQGININPTFREHVIATNTEWSSKQGPPARMDENIDTYLNNVGKFTLWWYDTSIINN